MKKFLSGEVYNTGQGKKKKKRITPSEIYGLNYSSNDALLKGLKSGAISPWGKSI